MSRTVIKGLSAYEYQHPFDRKALILLKKTKGLSNFIRKVSEFGIETFSRILYTGSGLKVTASHFPDLHQLLLEGCRVLDIDSVPELYIIKAEETTLTIGVSNPIIVLSSTVIDNFTEEELLFIIGHQLSYIKSESLLYQQIAETIQLFTELSIGVSGLMSLLSLPLKLAIMNWKKMAAFTGDRAGLLCCQDTEAATSALIKLAGQPIKYYHQIDIDEFKRQALEFEEFDINTYNKVIKLLLALDQSHPEYVIRGAQFFKWIKSGDFERIMERKPVLNSADQSRCSFCGEKIRGDETFCTHCGNKIGQLTIQCRSCGHNILENDLFCTNCGISQMEV